MTISIIEQSNTNIHNMAGFSDWDPK